MKDVLNAPFGSLGENETQRVQSSEFRVYYSQKRGKPAGIALQAAPREHHGHRRGDKQRTTCTMIP